MTTCVIGRFILSFLLIGEDNSIRAGFHAKMGYHVRQVFPYLASLDNFMRDGRSKFEQKNVDTKRKYEEAKSEPQRELEPGTRDLEVVGQKEFKALRRAELSLEHFLESSPTRVRIRYFTSEHEGRPPKEMQFQSMYELYSALQRGQHKRSNTARLILVEDMSPYLAELLGHFLHLDLDFLNDHIRKVNQHASVELPSYSEPVSHLLVPFRRLCPEPDADFSQENFHSREEHASIAFCPEDGWKWTVSANDSLRILVTN